MMNGVASNGATQVPEGWLSATDLHKRHPGGSLRSIHRWGEAGRIGRVKDAGGRVWFDPADYAAALHAEAELEPSEADKLEVHKTQVLTTGSNDLLRQLMRHNEQMMAPAAKAQQELLELLKEENKELRQQNARMAEMHLQNMQAREELLSEAHARTIELRAFEASEARKQAALEMAKGPVKQLLARFAGGAQQNDTLPATSSKLAPARALLASLTDDQLTMLLSVESVRETLVALLDTEVLSDEQKGHVREVLV